MRVMVKLQEISTLNRPSLRRNKGEKAYTLRLHQLYWKASCFQAMGSGMGGKHKGSFVFSLVAETYMEMSKTEIIPTTVNLRTNVTHEFGKVDIEARSLGIISDLELSFKKQTDTVVKNCNFHIHNMHAIRKIF